MEITNLVVDDFRFRLLEQSYISRITSGGVCLMIRSTSLAIWVPSVRLGF